jgi:hypothetical protein
VSPNEWNVTGYQLLNPFDRTLFHGPFMVEGPYIWRQTEHILTRSCLNIPIPEEGEPVLVSIADIVVFESWLLDRFEEVYRLYTASALANVARLEWELRGSTYRSRPQVDPILDFSVLEPTPTFLLPNGIRVESIKMCVDVIEGLLFDLERFDAFGLDLLDHFHGVFNRCFNGGQEGAI